MPQASIVIESRRRCTGIMGLDPAVQPLDLALQEADEGDAIPQRTQSSPSCNSL
jgi:hypothetical protein